MRHQVGIIGLGRFGRFWAQFLSRDFDVVGTSRRDIPDLPAAVKQVPLEEIGTVDTVFLCVSISSLESVLPRLTPQLRAGQTVIDTCSVKTYPVEQMIRFLPESVHIIASHPMFGPDSAEERADRLPIITHPVRIPDSDYTSWRERFYSLGLRVIELTPEEHDLEAAYTQGITHYIGRILAEMDLRPSPIATLGYKRLLQVMEQTCNDPVQLFRDLQRYNPYTREMRDTLQRARESTEEMIDKAP